MGHGGAEAAGAHDGYLGEDGRTIDIQKIIALT